MWLELIAVSFWGGIVAMDTTAALQIMISRPLVSCSIIGLLLGDFQLGLIIGIFLELLWINELPVGAARFSEGNVGATAAAAIAITSKELTFREGPSMAFALICAVFISIVGGYLVEYMRKINSKSFENLLKAKDLTINKVFKTHVSGIGLAFLLGFFLTGTSLILIGKLLLPRIIAFIPENYDKLFNPVGISFLGVGCGVLIYMYIRNSKYWLLIFAGLFIGFLVF